MFRTFTMALAMAGLLGSTAYAEAPVAAEEQGQFQIFDESFDLNAVDGTNMMDETMNSVDAQARYPRPRPRPPRPNPIGVVGVRCGAPLWGTQYCSIGRQVRSVQLMRRWSAAPCLRGQTWGIFNSGVWTSRGCGADFRIEYYR